MPCLQQRKTLRRFASCTRCHDASGVSSTDESSVGLIPALLKRTSMWPNSSFARAYRLRTCSSSVRSASSARSPSEPGLMSTPTTLISSANNRAVSAPMPLAAPVITLTFPSSLPPITCPPLRRIRSSRPCSGRARPARARVRNRTA